MAVIVTNSVSDITQTLRINSPESAGSFQVLPIPTGVFLLPRRPCFLQYKKQLLILGHYTGNLIIDPFLQVHVAGIAPPTNAPTLAATTGTITADTCTGYITYLQKFGSHIVAESNPSPPSNTIALAAQGRTWTNIPTSSPNARVTHIRGYVLVDGADARMAFERQIGPSTVTETLPTLQLGDVINFNRGVPPAAVFGEVYHDRIWYVDANDRTKVWYTEQFEPESVGPTSYFTTWDGEFITGIKRNGDTLLIFARNVCYALTGWEEADFQLRKISPSVGCISHYSLVDINGRTWFASQDGVYIYDGAFHPMMKDLASYWRDAYLADLENYENSIAADDRFWNVYKLLIPGDSSSFYYIGAYRGVEPEISGNADQPKWSFDIRTRLDYTVGIIRSANSNREEIYTGSFDGRIRKENVEADTDDLSDAYSKALTIRLPFYVFEDPGGDLREGKNLKQSWAYVESENQAWTQEFFGGDEWCGDAVTAAFTKTWAAGTLELGVTSAPNVIPHGTPGSTHYNYIIVANNGAGHGRNSGEGFTTTGNFTLSVTNFNRITWDPVSGATSYSIYRTLGSSTGLVGTATSTTFDDTGFAGDGTSPDDTSTSSRLPRTVWFWLPERVTGRGFTEIIEASAPKSFVFRGIGGIHDIGTAFRGTP
jgi:hypothetical protein